MKPDAAPSTSAGWQPLPPERLPRPTPFPAALAMGTAFLLWGLISSWIVLLFGGALCVVGLMGWINEIRHERNQS